MDWTQDDAILQTSLGFKSKSNIAHLRAKWNKRKGDIGAQKKERGASAYWQEYIESVRAMEGKVTLEEAIIKSGYQGKKSLFAATMRRWCAPLKKKRRFTHDWEKVKEWNKHYKEIAKEVGCDPSQAHRMKREFLEKMNGEGTNV